MKTFVFIDASNLFYGGENGARKIYYFGGLKFIITRMII